MLKLGTHGTSRQRSNSFLSNQSCARRQEPKGRGARKFVALCWLMVKSRPRLKLLRFQHAPWQSLGASHRRFSTANLIA